MTWQVGEVVDGRYEVSGVLGRGGMGVVHRVRHLAWAVELAVKSPDPRLFQDEEQQREFIAEAETWVSLGLHPHVCGCHYVRVLDGVPRLFAEYVAGGSLWDWIEDRRLYAGGPDEALARLLDVAVQIAWGLDHAHGRGIVHRDVKPANVLLDGEVGDAVTAKITDFGLAKARRLVALAPGATQGVSVPVPGDGGMTPRYASPEQAAGHPVGRRTDIYSFAVSLLEMVTGGASWMAGPAAGAALAAIRAGQPGSPPLPSALADLLEACLARDPARRPSSLTAVAAELARIYQEVTGTRYPRHEPVAAELRADELNNRALSLLDLGRAAEAGQAFAAALSADPQHREATYNTGLRRWRSGDITDEALVADLDRVRESDDDPGQSRHLLAKVHLERGDLVAARRLLDGNGAGDPEVAATLTAVQTGQVRDAKCLGTKVMRWRPKGLRGRWREVEQLMGIDDTGTPTRIAGDAPFALTGCRNGEAWLWDLRTAEYLRTFIKHDPAVHAVDLTPDGCFGATAGSDATVRVWDLAASKCLHTVKAARHPAEQPRQCAVRLSADARYLLWAGGGTVLLWDLRTGKRRKLHRDRNGGGGSSAIDLRGGCALFADRTHIRLWDTGTGRQRRVWELPEPSAPSALSLSADGRFVVTGAAHTGAIRLWDVETGDCVRTMTGHTSTVQALSMSDDARFLFSGAQDATVRFWRTDTGCCLRTFRTGEAYPRVEDVLLDGDGGAGVSVDDEQTVRRWQMPSGYTAAHQLSRPRPYLELAELHSLVEKRVGDAERAIAASAFPAALDLLTRAREVPGYEREPRTLAAWRTLAAHSARTGLRDAWPSKVLATGSVAAADLAGDGRIAVTGGFDGMIQVWEVAGGTSARVLEWPRRGDGMDAVKSLSLSQDGKRVLSGHVSVAEGLSGSIRLWSTETGECLRELSGTDFVPEDVRFSADGRNAVAGLMGGKVRLWDLSTGRPLWTVDAHPGKSITGRAGVSVVRPDPTGRFVVSAGYDGFVRLTALGSGEVVRSIDAHDDVAWSVSPSADGRFLLSTGGHRDRNIRMWDTGTGERVGQFGIPGHEPETAQFTTDGRFAVSAGLDSTLRVWDVRAGKCVRLLQGHRKGVTGLAMTSDGRSVLSWSIGDKTARLWELDWALTAHAPSDWDDGAMPYLTAFRQRCPQWTRPDVDALLRQLQDAGFGWLRADGVRARLGHLAPGAAG
ncbi:serine/threonine-protein kinase [Amycolatopsis minnesotensis]|uniref:Protein kinase domain-containing protein n=1 Tax=Amycolatopsis minnesotensis TaxID=337894 RepID=A0ABP5E7Y2_9PSEU